MYAGATRVRFHGGAGRGGGGVSYASTSRSSVPRRRVERDLARADRREERHDGRRRRVDVRRDPAGTQGIDVAVAVLLDEVHVPEARLDRADLVSGRDVRRGRRRPDRRASTRTCGRRRRRRARRCRAGAARRRRRPRTPASRRAPRCRSRSGTTRGRFPPRAGRRRSCARRAGGRRAAAASRRLLAQRSEMRERQAEQRPRTRPLGIACAELRSSAGTRGSTTSRTMTCTAVAASRRPEVHRRSRPSRRRRRSGSARRGRPSSPG